MTRTNTIGETLSKHDEHEDCPPVGSDEADALEVAADIRKLLDSAPAHIWLDLGENLEALDDNASFRDLTEVTWSEDNATGVGIKYVRADAADELLEFAKFVLRGVSTGAIKASAFMKIDQNADSLEFKTLGAYAAEVIARTTGETP